MNTEEIKSVYSQSIEGSDNPIGLLIHLQNDPEMLKHILWIYIWNVADAFIATKGETGFRDSPDLWNLVPELFAEGIRKAIMRLKFRTSHDESEAIYSTPEILEWLKETFPEILEDAESEEMQIDANNSSQISKDQSEEFLRKLFKRSDESE